MKAGSRHPWKIRRRARAVWSSQRGFSLVESIIAIGLLAVLMLGLSGVLLTSYRSLSVNRRYQQATGLANSLIESARAVDFDALSMTNSDLNAATDSRLKTSCTGLTGSFFIDPDGSGPLKCELLVSSAAGGSMPAHMETKSVGGQAYSVSSYISWVSATTQGGTAQDMKRYTVNVDWTTAGKARNFRTSTIITRSRRGLPAPKFSLTPSSQSKIAAPGNDVWMPLSIKTLGINDTYDLEIQKDNDRPWTFSFYKDVNQNSQYDAGTDTLMSDTNGNGFPDTGIVSTSQTYYFIVKWNIGASEAGGIEKLNVIAYSGIDATVSRTADFRLNIGDYIEHLYLHNLPSPPVGDTNKQQPLYMDLEAPTATTLYLYSKDKYTNSPGRFLDKGNHNHDEDNKDKMVNWVFQMDGNAHLKGTATVRIWAQQKDQKCDKPVSIKAYVRVKPDPVNKTGTQLGSGQVTLAAPGGTAPCPFRQFDLNIPIDANVSQNSWIELKIIAADPGGAEDAVVAYDTVTYPAYFDLPFTSS